MRHKGLLYTLETVGISSNLHKRFQSFICDTLKNLVLNGRSSNWSPILAGVPQGTILGPLLFLVYINDFPDNLESLAKLLADDTSLFSTVFNSLPSTDIIRISLKLLNGLISRKCPLIQIKLNKHSKLFSHGNLTKQTI